MKITNLLALSEAVQENLRLKAEIEELTKRRNALKDDMTAYLKKHKMSSVTIDGTRVSYGPYSVTRFNTTLFEEQHKKLYEKYVKTDWFTKLTITPKKVATPKEAKKEAVPKRSATQKSRSDS